ncbi:serine/threonine protein kinase [Tritonibacter multivorans]|uniref:Serine/threonine protein kinase n=1 Tax=Tritonibacter multivorans TaxID=928856 RepID=A0A0P1GU39_9RHOB|nr:phosphotransferase [Tritonibacter multivorans]MDA7421372.1 phosphotransferase [Tritonibacter multivorans]CUH78911.1 serine/threonine protein kinase [Tritonibacter multivorans]SFD27764.1 Phosphotransferase enzyme family protein [Tritonibacter multivorans]
MSQDEQSADAVQLRTQALWPQIAADLGLSGDGAGFQRLRVNRRMAARRCAMVVRDTGGGAYVLRADFGAGGEAAFQKVLARHIAAEEGLRDVPGVRVPKVLWRDPEQKIILLEFVPGDTLFREMTAADLGMVSRGEVLEQAGRAIAALHRCSQVGARKFWPKAHLERVSQVAQEVRGGLREVHRPKRFLGLCAHLHKAGRAARGHPFEGALEHGDLHMRNVLLSGEDLWFIDFANHSGIYPQRDIANFWLANGMFHLIAPEDDGEVAAGFCMVAQADWAAFERGYGAGLSDDPVVRFFFALRVFDAWLKQGHQRDGLTAEQVRRRTERLERVLSSLQASVA